MSIVKDLSLSPSGLQKIQWVRDFMPALGGIEARFEQEQPFDFDHPIMKAPHTVLSAHAAYWSEEAGLELRTRMTQNAIDVVLGREPHDCLNKQVFANGKLKKLSAAK